LDIAVNKIRVCVALLLLSQLCGCPKQEYWYFSNQSGREVKLDFLDSSATIVPPGGRVLMPHGLIRARKEEMFGGVKWPVGALDVVTRGRSLTFPIRGYRIPKAYWGVSGDSICFLLDAKLQLALAQPRASGDCTPYRRQPTTFPQPAEALVHR
jgi:hypothetical protein